MSGIATKTKKYAILFHRWLGVAFCILFALWFVSGIVMMYWTFPEITQREALERAPALDAAAVKLSAAEAFEKIQPADTPTRASLETLNGRPIYRFYWGRDQLGVWADTGEPFEAVTESLARSVAARFTGQAASSVRFEGRITEADQWTVQSNYRSHMPLLKFSWPDGEEVYVSSVTGEAVQHSTRGSRIGAYFGAIPHWLYFLPLRENTKLWNDVVVWSSGIGTIMSLLGIAIGLWLYSPSKRYRFPSGARSVPYTGQKRWHTILGLFFGLTVCTWAFSGMMSMEPFDLSWGRRSPRVAGSLQDNLPELGAFAARHPRDVIASLAGSFEVKRLELGSFAGEPLYIATEAEHHTSIIPMAGTAREAFDTGAIEQSLLNATRSQSIAEKRLVTEFEAYYVDRHGQRPLPVLYYRLNDEAGSAFYVDPKTARVVARYGAGSRLNRWLYHGLHSLDFPILYRYRPLWDIVVLALMLGGTALCVTSLVIAWRRLKRKAVQLSH